MNSNYKKKSAVNSSSRLKKTACVLTAGMMMFSAAAMTACGNKDNSSQPNSANTVSEEQLKALSYELKDIVLQGDENTNFGNIVYKNDKLYTTSYIYNYDEATETYSSTVNIVIANMEGNIETTIPVFIQTDDYTYGGVQGDLSIGDDGSISYIYYESTYNDTTGESSDSMLLKKLSATGEELSSSPLDYIVTDEEQQNGMWLNNILITSDGTLYCNLGTCVRVIGADGTVLFTTEPFDNGDTWINSFIFTNEGIPAVSVYTYDSTTDTSENILREIDTAAKGYGKEYKIDNSYSLYNGGGDYLAYTQGDTGLKGMKYDPATDTVTTENVINLLSIGVDTSNMNSCAVAADGTVIISSWNYGGGGTTVTLATPVESTAAAEKQVINLGCFYIDWQIRSDIASFNRESDKYILQCESFSDTNDTSDWEAALTKFNNEILAGNVPDILLLNNQMPVDSYISKGMFTDLYEYIDKDDTINRENLAPNVLSALERDGKLYSITPSFAVQTYAAKTSLVGTDTHITIEKAKEVLSGMAEGATMFGMTTSLDILNSGITYGDFVDYKNADCHFDSDEFKALLELANEYPAEIDYDALYEQNPNYWEDEQLAYSQNKTLFYSQYLSSFDSRYVEATMGEDVTFTGFPCSSEDGGSVISFSTELAISSKSQCKDGAWEFIKQVMSDTSQDNGYYYNFPTYLPELDKMAAKALADAQPQVNEDGTTSEYYNSYWIGNEEVKLEPIDQAYIDKIKNYVLSVKKTYRYDRSLMDIVNEEANSYFNGTKSIDETVSIIQSRAKIYLSEQS
ncbi:MAG: ABC transporter substrate-binding protein [Huintestinicola sp.]